MIIVIIISHWKVIITDMSKFEQWHKPQQIKEACVPDSTTASAGEQKLNSIVWQWVCVIALFRANEAWTPIAGPKLYPR